MSQPCSSYKVDVTANTFGTCVCGYTKNDHSQDALLPQRKSVNARSPPMPSANSQQPILSGGLFKVRALFDFNSQNPNDISFRSGDHLVVTKQVNGDWYEGRDGHGKTGMFPINFVDRIRGTPEPGQRPDLSLQAPSRETMTIEERTAALKLNTGEVPLPSAKKPKIFFQAIDNFTASHDDDLSLSTGDIICLDEQIDINWMKGHLARQPTSKGMFPCNFVKKLEPQDVPADLKSPRPTMRHAVLAVEATSAFRSQAPPPPQRSPSMTSGPPPPRRSASVETLTPPIPLRSSSIETLPTPPMVPPPLYSTETTSPKSGVPPPPPISPRSSRPLSTNRGPVAEMKAGVSEGYYPRPFEQAHSGIPPEPWFVRGEDEFTVLQTTKQGGLLVGSVLKLEKYTIMKADRTQIQLEIMQGSNENQAKYRADVKPFPMPPAAILELSGKKFGPLILGYAQKNVGRQIGDGSTKDMITTCLAAARCEPPTWNNYGARIELSAILPGDILHLKSCQFYNGVVTQDNSVVIVFRMHPNQTAQVLQQRNKIVEYADYPLTSLQSGVIIAFRPLPPKGVRIEDMYQ